MSSPDDDHARSGQGSASGAASGPPVGPDGSSPPADAPPRGRYRRRRLHAGVFAVAVLLVLVLGAAAGASVAGLWQWPGQGSADGSPEPAECPPPTAPAAPVEQSEVNVYNSTDRRGLAAGVAQGLRSRGFPVLAVDNDPLDAGVQEPAQVRHGPQGLEAARTVAAQVDGAVLVDDGRTGAAVDLVLGAGYQQLRGPAQAAAQLQGEPPPAGCSPAPSTPTPSAADDPSATSPPAP